MNRLVIAAAGSALALLAVSCEGKDGPDCPTNEQVTPRPDRVTVIEYRPAPGQFINEDTLLTTATAAAEWAQKRLERGLYVSLGAFGGYIVAVFPEPVTEFIIRGNAFVSASGASNEPGIVWVMADTNGNGEPDDTWYELRGSETDAAGTIRGYAVTYRQPAGPGEPVRWTDNQGGSGQIDYLGMFHRQDSYYPAWVTGAQLTLRGTRVEARVSRDTNGMWRSDPLGWGYADNEGSDRGVFRVADAIDHSGAKAPIKTADFVKVQTGAVGSCGHLGELSTEVTFIGQVTTQDAW